MTRTELSLRLLLDENLPVGLKALLVNHSVSTIRDMGWTGIQNGLLLDTAERDGFEVLLTADEALYRQQHVERRAIAVVRLSTSHWQTVKAGVAMILEALNGIRPGQLRMVELGRPPHKR